MIISRRSAGSVIRRAPARSAYRAAPASSVKRAPAGSVKRAPASSVKSAPQRSKKSAAAGSVKTARTAKLATPRGSVKRAPAGSVKTAPKPDSSGVIGRANITKVSIRNSPIMQELAGRKQDVKRPSYPAAPLTPVFQKEGDRTILMSEDPTKQPTQTLTERIKERAAEQVESGKKAGGVPIPGGGTIGPVQSPGKQHESQQTQRGPKRRSGGYGRAGVNFRF